MANARLHRSEHQRLLRAGCRALVAWSLLLVASPESIADGEDTYGYKTPSRDGIGKTYMGREISRVMGHRGAGWLERPSRESEERTDLLLDMLPVDDDSVIADIGAGTGYFTIPLARLTPAGRVYAVDIQPEMLDIIEQRASDSGLDNISLVLADETDPKLPRASADLVLIVDAYHEFAYPREVMDGISAALRPGGRLYLVEYRAEDPQVPIKLLHKMSEAQAIREVEATGLAWVKTLDRLPQQHVLVFRKHD